MNLQDMIEAIGRLRYGVSTGEKESLARSGSLPGAPKDTSADQAAADRYAAGYLFAQHYPTLAPLILPLINQLKTSDLPILGGESPELQSYATQGANMAGMNLGQIMRR